MSTISLYLRHISETRSKPQPRTTPSLRHDYFVIMATSSIFVGTVLITMVISPLLIISTSGLTMNDISDCRKKIIESEQKGYYSSPDQFRLAESYCYIRQNRWGHLQDHSIRKRGKKFSSSTSLRFCECVHPKIIVCNIYFQR